MEYNIALALSLINVIGGLQARSTSILFTGVGTTGSPGAGRELRGGADRRDVR